MSNILVNKVEGDTLQALEWNQLAEINNLITSSEQNLDANILEQIAKAVANYVNSGNFYTENGVADSYTLIGAGSFKTPTAYKNGMVIRFITTNANTTTTPIVNLASLGAKNIKKADGTAVVAGDISGYVELRYNGTDFLLSPLSSALNITATNKGLTYLNNPITIANNTTDADNDIDFTAGNFVFSDGSGQAVVSALTKRLDASWTAGNNQGGLDTGTKANNTWYHCYAIYNPTSGVSDAIFSANATTPTLPTGYTKYNLIESIFTNSSGNILPFYQKIGENYIATFLKDKPLDISISSTPTTKTNYPITSPLGRSVMQIVRATLYWGGDSADRAINILSPFDNSVAPSATQADLQSDINYISSIEKRVVTNTSSQISIICNHSTVTAFNLVSLGWIK